MERGKRLKRMFVPISIPLIAEIGDAITKHYAS
jgi:hypothetical protein